MTPKTPMRFAGLPVFVLCAALALLAPVAESAAADPSEDRGRVVYRRACAACHGNAGDGNAPVARYLDPRPRDFTFGIYKFSSTPFGMLPSDDDLYRVVREGVPTTTMPAFERLLTEQERRDVVAYIKTFSENFEVMPAADPIVIPDEPEVSAEAVRDGKHIYMLTGCWTCHGPRGTGAGDAATVLEDAWGQVVRPVDFTKGSYKSGHGSQAIFRAIESGIMGTPMPGYATAFAYTSDAAQLPDKMEDSYDAGEIAAAQAYLDAQPRRSELDGMSDAEKANLIAARKWALVHYLMSLAEEPSFWYTQFVQDTEVTR